MIEKEFAPYEPALALKELGFDEPCFGNWQDMKEETPWFSKSYADNQNQYYGQLCSAPTFSQAFRFFRENYKLYPEIGLHDREDEQTWRFSISVLGYYELAYNQNVGREPYHKTYEEAELACLKKLIEIVKNK